MIKYIVDEENRKVTAVMNYNADVLVKKANNIFGDIISDKVKKKLMLKSEYRATANCHIEDTFNPEIGKRLARGYVLKKLEDDRKRVNKRFVDAIVGTCSKLDTFYCGLRDIAFHLTYCLPAIDDMYNTFYMDNDADWDNGVDWDNDADWDNDVDWDNDADWDNDVEFFNKIQL